MIYPITPAYLDGQPEKIAELYRGLEDFILRDICERFRLSGTATNTAIEQIRILQRRGYSLERIEEYIRKMLKLTQTQLDAILDDAVERNQIYYTETLTRDRLLAAGFDERALLDELDIIRRRTATELENITGTMGFVTQGPDGRLAFAPLTEAYNKTLDDAALRVLSGGESYEQAIQHATTKLARSGVQWIDYRSGWHNRIDVAARRAVMTSITQVSGQYGEAIAGAVPTKCWEITAHAGARDKPGPNPWSSHKDWQGKVYSEGGMEGFPDLYAVTGYGEVDGLMGANCRHMKEPFWPGISERTYTDEELASIDPPPFEFEGKTYTAYEATQMQRRLETSMRDLRRQLVANKATGNEEKFTADAVKYRALNEKYRAFSEKAGLPLQQDRMRVEEFDSKTAREAERAAEKEVAKYSSYHYNEDGTIVVTDDWRERQHPTIPLKYKPFAVVDTTSQNDRQRDRTYFDGSGSQTKQISNGPHGNPKKHPYGKHGEHAHDIVLQPDGKTIRPRRDLTDSERNENADIL